FGVTDKEALLQTLAADEDYVVKLTLQEAQKDKFTEFDLALRLQHYLPSALEMDYEEANEEQDTEWNGDMQGHRLVIIAASRKQADKLSDLFDQYHHHREPDEPVSDLLLSLGNGEYLCLATEGYQGEEAALKELEQRKAARNTPQLRQDAAWQSAID